MYEKKKAVQSLLCFQEERRKMRLLSSSDVHSVTTSCLQATSATTNSNTLGSQVVLWHQLFEPESENGHSDGNKQW